MALRHLGILDLPENLEHLGVLLFLGHLGILDLPEPLVHLEDPIMKFRLYLEILDLLVNLEHLEAL